MHSFHINRNCSIMKIVLFLSVVFLDYALTTYAGISHAETSDITRLTEGVPSPECNEEGCIVQDEGVNLINKVIVHKRHVNHKRHGQSVRHQIYQTAKEAKSITKRINYEVMKIKLKTMKLAKYRITNLLRMSNAISNLVKKSTLDYSNIALRPDVVKNITVSNAQKTLRLVNKTVDTWFKSIKESAANMKELTKLRLDEMKKFFYNSNEKVKAAVRSGDVEGAKTILDENHKTTQQMVESIRKRAKEVQDAAERHVKSLDIAGNNAMADMARKQAEQLKEMAMQNPRYKAIHSVSTKVTQYSHDSAATSRELTNYQLQLANEYRKHIDKIIQKFSDQAYEVGQAIVNSDAVAVRKKETALNETFKEAEDENERYFNKLVNEAQKKVSIVFSKNIDYVSSLKNDFKNAADVQETTDEIPRSEIVSNLSPNSEEVSTEDANSVETDDILNLPEENQNRFLQQDEDVWQQAISLASTSLKHPMVLSALTVENIILMIRTGVTEITKSTMTHVQKMGKSSLDLGAKLYEFVESGENEKAEIYSKNASETIFMLSKIFHNTLFELYEETRCYASNYTEKNVELILKTIDYEVDKLKHFGLQSSAKVEAYTRRISKLIREYGDKTTSKIQVEGSKTDGFKKVITETERLLGVYAENVRDLFTYIVSKFISFEGLQKAIVLMGKAFRKSLNEPFTILYTDLSSREKRMASFNFKQLTEIEAIISRGGNARVNNR